MVESDTGLVSVGVPVFNGGATLRRLLSSLISQTHTALQIIISDNASTDETQAICLEFAARDPRVAYHRQVSNIGGALNFKEVLFRSSGRYFMWAAADDWFSNDFVSENVCFLELNQEYIASSSPNCYEGEEAAISVHVDFALVGSLENRIRTFFENCWISHGIFFSIIRMDELKKCEVIGQSFTGADWAIDLYLISKGPINRTKQGLLVIGLGGLSTSADAYKHFRNSRLEFFVPFLKMGRYAIRYTRAANFLTRIYVLGAVVQVNVRGLRDQLRAILYNFYRDNLRSLIKKESS